jgi:hypothetical protein
MAAKPFEDDAGIRALGLIHACHPHLMCTDIGDYDVLGRKGLAQVPDDLLRFDREALIVGEACHLLHDCTPQGFQRRVVLRTGAESDAAQRLADIAQRSGGDNVAFVDFRRRGRRCE